MHSFMKVPLSALCVALACATPTITRADSIADF
ncbi:MAG: hypothetical protein JWL62_770, partial [Hyphomicrobiales bacterium]|nr:hypothetical protein [Hyphomicrobiales bacterium]